MHKKRAYFFFPKEGPFWRRKKCRKTTSLIGNDFYYIPGKLRYDTSLYADRTPCSLITSDWSTAIPYYLHSCIFAERSAAARLGRRRRRTDFGRLVDRAAVLQHHHQPRSHQRRGFVFSTRHQNATTTNRSRRRGRGARVCPVEEASQQTFAKSDPIFMSQFLSDVIRAQMWSNDFVRERRRRPILRMEEEDDEAQIFSREKECAKMLAQIGGTMRAYYKATTGEHDGVVVLLPEEPRRARLRTNRQKFGENRKNVHDETDDERRQRNSRSRRRRSRQMVDKYGGGPVSDVVTSTNVIE